MSRSRQVPSRPRGGWTAAQRRERFVVPRLEILERRDVPTFTFFGGFGIGGSGDDLGKTVCSDAAGNFIMGGWLGGTADFDMSPTVVNLTSAGSYDGVVAKYDAWGILLWARQFAGGLENGVNAVTVDAAGYVYVSGAFSGTVDFDPGPDTFNLTSFGGNDAFVAKLDSSGNFVWARQMGGGGEDYAIIGISVDRTGNVYTTGNFSGTADFDPGQGVSNLTSAGSLDVFVLKLNNSGNLVWARRMGGGNEDWGWDLATDANDNVYIGGYFQGTGDYDPGPGVYNLSSAGGDDGFVTKLDSSGNLVWVRQVGGTGLDILTAVIADDSGNVYFTGGFTYTPDFDPGPGTYNVSWNGGPDAWGYDIFVEKVDPAGNFLWVKTMGSTSYDCGFNSIALDSGGNVYTAGYFSGTVDFDPGSGGFNLTSAGSRDIYVSVLDGAGTFVDACRFGGTSDDFTPFIDLDSNDSLLVTGYYKGTADINPGPGVYNLSSAGQNDMVLVKLTQRMLRGRVWDDSNGDGLQDGGEPGLAGATVDLFDAVDGIIGNGNDVLIETATSQTDGRYGLAGVAASTGYYIKVSQPAGTSGISPPYYTSTLQGQGFDPTLDSDVNAAGVSGVFPLAIGTPLVLDAGLIETPPPFRAWVFGGMGDDRPRAIGVDASGNVYVTGWFEGTVDIDPGPGQLNLTSAGLRDVYVAKYSPAGALLWAYRTGSASDENPNALVVDASGNLYVAGVFNGTVDFDPGPGVVNLTSAGSNDPFLTRIDSSGNLIWAKRFGGTDSDILEEMVLGDSNSIVVTGSFRSTVDFDPGPGTTNLTSVGADDSFVARFDGAGNLIWARAMGGPATDEGTWLAIDSAGNVILTGYFSGTADFNPGPGTFNLTSAGGDDAYVCKLDASGNFVWAGSIGGSGDDYRGGVAVDAAGNIYTIGRFTGTADLDPGPGVHNATSAGGRDTYICKVDAAGNFDWAYGIGGSGDDVLGPVRLDAAGNVYSAGAFSSTVDFDPGAGIYNLTSAGGYDAVVYKLDSNGQFLWASRLGGSGDDGSTAPIVVDASGQIYVAGTFTGTTNLDPSSGTFRPAGQGGNDIFVVRLTQATVQGRVWQDVNDNGIQDAGETGLAGAAVELFDTVDGIVGNGNDVSVNKATTAADGVYRFTRVAGSAVYYVQVQQPQAVSGYVPPPCTFTAAGQGDPAADSDVDATGRTSLFRLTPGAPTTLDAGLQQGTTAFQVWAAGGPSDDSGRTIATDAAGNVYVAGWLQGTADFDPSATVFNLTSAGVNDAVVAKYSPSGALLWVSRLGGSSDDHVTALGVDASGAVYLAGSFIGTADFDPGPAIVNLTSAGSWDVFVARLKLDGSLDWARRVGGSSLESAGAGLAVDAAGTVYVTGSFPGTVDFNPGAGTNNLISAGGTDAFVLALDVTGNYVWAKRFGGTGNEDGADVTRDAAGNVYATGSFSNTANFDSGTGTANRTSAGGTDAYAVKLDPAGTSVWAVSVGGTGTDAGRRVVVDGTGQVLVAGTFSGTADFDPGAGTSNRTSAGGLDQFVVALNSAGGLAWARSLGGSGDDVAYGLAVDVAGGVYVAGSFTGTADFDPGAGTTNLTSAGGTDVSLTKLNAAGDLVWVRQLGGTGNDAALALAVDAASGVWTTGSYSGTVDFDPGAGSFPVTALGGTDWFAHKIGQAILRGRVWQDDNGDGIQTVDEPALANFTVELFDAIDPVIGDGDDISLGTVVTAADGSYRFASPSIGSSYYIQVRRPTGTSGNTPPYLAFTLQAQGTDRSVDSDVGYTGRSGLFPITEGMSTILDAGLQPVVPAFRAWGVGGSGDDTGRAVCTDTAGNVYVAGAIRGTADFDPTPGGWDLASAGGQDAVVARYNPDGTLAWAVGLGGSLDDVATGVAVDAAGNVYVTGTFQGTADFDPSGGVFNRASAGGTDVFVVKLNVTSGLVWAAAVGGAGDDAAGVGLAVDAGGAVYTTGSFTGSADFDPGDGATQLTSAGASDAFVLALTATGNLAWVRQLGGAGADQGWGLALDAAGNVCTTGSFSGAGDFDPGIGTTTLTGAGGTDVYVSKLTTAGVFVWARALGGPGDDVGRRIAVDATGQVYVAGSFSATGDFDPGAGTTALTSAGGTDQFVTRLDGAGLLVWARALGGSGDDVGTGLAVDPAGNVYVGGSFSGTADFDPGSGTFNLTSGGGSDASVVELDSAGNLRWARALGGTADDTGLALAVDRTGGIWTTGGYTGTVDFDPSGGAFPLAALGGTDLYVSKMSQPGIQGRVWLDGNGNGIQDTGEPGLAGAVVELLDAGGASLGQQITAVDGTYRFDQPPPRSGYQVQIRPPAGTGPGNVAPLSFSPRNVGDNRDRDSDVFAAGYTSVFSLPVGSSLTVDAGLVGAVSSTGAAWTAAGPADEIGLAITRDASGDVYVVGSFQGTVDFDAGPGTANLTSAGGRDAFVAHYNSAGALLWVRRLGGPGDDQATAVALAANGNLLVTGTFQGTADLDPGPGSSTLTSAGGQDLFVVTLSSAGALVGTPRRLGGSGDDLATAVAGDGNGNLYLAGSFSGTVDFDPGTAVVNLTSLGSRDGFVSKWGPTGGLAWARRVGGPNGDDAATALAVDASGGVFVTGTFSGTADFDPGTAVTDLGSDGLRDIFVWKLDLSGNLVWARRAGGPGDDSAAGLALQGGAVFVTGAYAGTADFDPGPDRFELRSAGGSDGFVWQLTAAGALGWAQALGGSGDDSAAALATDATGVYVAGDFQATADFDPAAGRLDLTSQGGSDTFVAKLDLSGNRQWARRLGGTGTDHGRGVAVGPDGAVVFTGAYAGSASFDPGEGDQGLPAAGQADLFVALVNPLASRTGILPDGYEPNSTRQAASDLGVINSQLILSNLSMHSAGNDDWFRFDLLASGQPANLVRIDFTHDNGDLDLELYRDTQLVAIAATSSSGVKYEQLSLAGQPAGTYYVRVRGAANPTYKLTLQVPRALPPDAFEPNDAPAQAADLGTLRDVATVSGLSVHLPGNDDWFTFTTVADGTATAQVRLDFRTAQGDLDVELFDTAGTLLRDSIGTSDSERISLAGLAAGTYRVRVYGHAGALNPAYTLTVQPPRQLLADRFEANDTRNQATPLGVLEGMQSWDGLSVHTAADQDWFSFTTRGIGQAGQLVAIDFSHADGDLDLRLYDAAGKLLAASTTTGDTEQVSLQGLPAGTYSVQVSGYAGATQPAYQLRTVTPVAGLAADRLEGEVRNESRATASVVRTEGKPKLEGVQEIADLNLHASSDQDWFTFTTVAPGGLRHSLTVSYPAANGNLSLELYSASGVKMASAAGAGGTAMLSLNGLAANSYYARVFSPAGAVNTYQLAFDTPLPAAGSVADDWTVLVYMTADTLVDRAFADLNEMELAAAALPGSVNLAVLLDQSAAYKTFPTGNGSQPAWGTTGRALVTPDTDLTRVATRFELLPEQNTGSPAALRSFVQWATTIAPARQYALIFWDHGGGLLGFNYDKSDGQAADRLTPSEVTTALAGLPRMDLVAFDACLMATTEVAYALRDLTDVVVGSQDVVPGDGFEYDQALAVLAANSAQVDAAALGTRLVQSYARRYGSTGTADTLSAVRTLGLTGLTTALQQFQSAVSTASAADRSLLVSLAAATLVPSQAALYQRDLGGFFRAVAGQWAETDPLEAAARSVLAALDQAMVSKTADLRGTSGLSLYLPVEQDAAQTVVVPDTYPDYTPEYPGFAADTGWLDVLSQLASSSGSRPDEEDGYDAASRNDVLSTASDLKRLIGPGHAYEGLSLHNETDRDWYRFQVEATAGAALTVQVTAGSVAPSSLVVSLRNAAGQPVLDAGGQPLVLSLSADQSGLLTVTGLPAGLSAFSLKVESAAAVPDYAFIVNAPGAGPDWAGSNDNPAKAYTLVGAGGGSFSGLSVASGETDWFRFDTPVLLTPMIRQLRVTVAGTDPAEVQLRDARGVVVGAAAGTGTLLVPYTQYGLGESYTLLVYNPGGAIVPYSLRLDEPQAANPSYPFDRFTRSAGGLGTSWSTSGAPQIQANQVTMTGTSSGRALWQGFTAADVGVQAKVQLPATGNATASVLVRTNLVNARLTGYEGRIVRLNGVVTAQLVRWTAGTAAVLGSVVVKGTTGGVLRLEAVGQRLRLQLDGRTLIEVTDRVTVAAGQAGFAGTPRVTVDDFLAGRLALPLPVAYGDAAAGVGGAGAAWQAVAGTVAVQDRRLVASGGLATAVYAPAWLADVAVTAKYALQLGQSVGLLARHSGSGTTRSYYQGRLTRSASGTVTVALLRVQGATTTTLPLLATTPVVVPPQGQLRLEVRGTLLRLLVDGRPVAVARDAVLASPGQVGLTLSAAAFLDELSAEALPAPAALPSGATAFSDDFNRANGAAGGGWLDRQGGLQVSGNQLRGGPAGLAVWTQAALANLAITAQVDMLAAGGTVGLVARYREPGTYYEGRLTNAGDGTVTAEIYRVYNGVATKLASAHWVVGATGSVRFEVVGTTLRLTFQGKTLAVVNTAIAGAGLAGVSLGSGAALDDLAVLAR